MSKAAKWSKKAPRPVRWTQVGELASWQNGEFGECTRDGGGYKKFRAAVCVGKFGVAPEKGWKVCIANLRKFGRDTKIIGRWGGPDRDLLPNTSVPFS